VRKYESMVEVDIQSATAEDRRGKKERKKKDKTTGRKYNCLSLPILTYGCDGISISRTNMQKMNVCWNNVFRKIFSMNVWESVKCVQLLCGTLDFIHIAFQHKLKFLNGLYKASSLVIKECFRYVPYGAKFWKLCEDCDVLIDNGCLRFDIYSKFKSLCSV